MKLLLFSLLLPTQLTLICQPGYLKCKDKTYILECKDNQGEDCIYHVDLPDGTYVYYSVRDTTTFTIDSGKVKEFRPFLKQKLTIYK
jgi:hypothetical protein